MTSAPRRAGVAAALIALVASLLVVLPGTSGRAADPSEGVVSPASPLVTWDGSAIAPANPAPSSGETDACPPRETDPGDAVCDHFLITVEGVDESTYETQKGTLVLSMLFDNGDDDWDFGLFRPGGALPVATAISSSNPEVISVPDPTGTYELRGAPYLAFEGYTGTAELKLEPLGTATDPLAPGFQSFTATRVSETPEADLVNTPAAYRGRPVAFANSDIGHGALEPTIGVDAEGNAYIAALGFQEDDLATTIQRSGDGGQSWQAVTPQVAGMDVPPNSNDPYVYVDTDTSRIFSIDLQALLNNSIFFSDDGGENWTPGGPSPTGIVTDHQTLTTGVVPENASVTTVGSYPEIVYYCFNRVAESTCERSLDGGLTFTRSGFPAFPGVDPDTGEDVPFCGGLHGHIETDDDGRLLLPKGHCGNPWIAVSDDAGETWTTAKVSDIEFPEQQASVSADSAGNLYYAFYDTNGMPYLAVSRDHGVTWEEPMMIAPPGVGEVQWPTVYAGDEGRVAVGFPCTRAQGDAAKSLSRPWDYCMVMSVDALEDEPTWLANVANEIGDPIHRGECPGRCGNMYDFLDVTAAPAEGGGLVWAVYTDTCTEKIYLDDDDEELPQCNISPEAIGFDGSNDNASNDERGTGVVQVCGPSLYELPDVDDACELLGAPDVAGGKVTVLGGEVAVSRTVDGQVNARGVQVDRIAGATRYATAADIARETFTTADTVYVATGELFPDGLAGAPAAAKADAPVLLTGRDSLPSETADALAAFAPDEVVVVGGPNAVSQGVVDEIADIVGTTPRRLAGGTRYDTAAQVSSDAYADGAGTVVVATGQDFPDALAGAAAAAQLDAPVLLTAQDVLPQATADELARLEPTRVLLLGGTVAISDDVARAVEDAAGVTPERLAGGTRYETAVEISSTVFPSRRTNVFLATGQQFPDALSGAAAAAQVGSPVLLTSRSELPSRTGDEIVRLLSVSVAPAGVR